jgi:diguanylate cyclase (GGDEF)-like protein
MDASGVSSLSGGKLDVDFDSNSADDGLKSEAYQPANRAVPLFMESNPSLDISNVRQKPHTDADEAKQDLWFLNEIIDLLPVGISLQTATGDFLFANAAAVQFSRGMEHSDQVLLASAGARPDKPEALEVDLACTVEEQRLEGTNTRTFLTTRKPVRVSNEILLLSSSFEITDRKQFEEELLRRVYSDELTGLPNRCQIQAQVERALGEDKNVFALAFLDIDNFKHINDYYSHETGDALLEKVSQRIIANIRSTDMLARIGGDEFLLLLNPIETRAQISAFITRFLDALKTPFFIDGLEISISASVGVSIYPEHGSDYETLRRNADTAMYQVKSSAKGSITIFDQELGRAVAARAELEQRLRLAVLDRRFRCAFQPKVDIWTREVVGVEALIRLVDEEGIIRGPSSFIQLATELGLINDLTLMVLDQVMNSIDHLNEAFGSHITISINVAAQQAGDMEFMTELMQSLRNTKCAERFMVEVTEDAVVAKSHFETHILPMLREIGVRVSIDDFGTGYSSLSALIGITAYELKIDRSFITNIQNSPRSQTVLKAIESISEALGMTIIAEGVETIEELTYLQTKTDIRYAQGYYFAKPLFFDELTPHKNASANLRRTNRGPSEKPGRHIRFR